MSQVKRTAGGAAILLSCSLAMLLSGCGAKTGSKPKPRFELPEKMIAGYTSGANPANITGAVKDGVNVIFWSFLQWENNTVIGDDIGSQVGALCKTMNCSDVLHFVSFGGWNVAHRIAGTCGASKCSADKYAAAFQAFDDAVKANVSGFAGFAGIDWDLEGMDALDAPSNEFSQETFELMIAVSQAVQAEGYLVSMVPPQSYFDCTTSGFDASLRHQADQSPADWTYHGLNAYTVIFAKCPECFDLVMVQYYEGYALDGFLLYWNGSKANVGAEGWPRNGTAEQQQRIIKENIDCLVNGWAVDFDGYMDMPNATQVTVPASKLVLGLANGWSGPYKFPFFSGVSCGKAWCEASQRIRGFAYWDIGQDNDGEPYQQSLVRDLSSTTQSCEDSAVSVTV